MNGPSSSLDQNWMQQALQLARLGQGRVEPNPMVGCVLVSGGELVGSGYHQYFGGPHAERMAVADARQAGLADRLAGATAYVTLEPCCHHGKTPPCTDLLVDVGIQRVVIAMQDPFSLVAGGGIEQLRSAGLKVETCTCEQEARELNAPYLTRLLRMRPWIIAKWAMSLDGRLATRTGDSKWISCQASRDLVHHLRGRMDAILVGSGTAAVDDPLLTARLPNGQPPLRKALRVVVDSELKTSPESKLALSANETPTLLWAGPLAENHRKTTLERLGCRVVICQTEDRNRRLENLMSFLASEYMATNVLVEGGQNLLGSLFDRKLIDECHCFVAPKIIGGQNAVSPIGGQGSTDISDGPACYAIRRQFAGDDLYLQCRLEWSTNR